MIWTVSLELKASQKAWSVVGGDPMLLAKYVSLANPGRRVTVEAMARIRAFWQDGELVSEFPDLEKFYSGTSERERHDWKHVIASREFESAEA